MNGGIVPEGVLVTGGQGSKPNLFLLNRTEKTIAFMELACSHFSSAEQAQKKNYYTQLSLDLSAKVFSVALCPLKFSLPHI